MVVESIGPGEVDDELIVSESSPWIGNAVGSRGVTRFATGRFDRLVNTEKETPLMATDYDEPRKEQADAQAQSLEEAKAAANGNKLQQPNIDEDENAAADSFELPGADLSNETLVVEVIPKQDNELTCSVCFLVHQNSAMSSFTPPVCRDCA
jgi:hypothetical protein